MPGDAVALACVDRAANGGAATRAWSAERFATACTGGAGERVLVCPAGGGLVAYIVYALAPGQASVHSIAVLAVRRRLGLGGAMMDAAFADMRASGAGRCLLEVRDSNTAARTFYESRGFGLDGVRRNYYPCDVGREDALLMSLRL